MNIVRFVIKRKKELSKDTKEMLAVFKKPVNFAFEKNIFGTVGICKKYFVESSLLEIKERLCSLQKK